MYLIHRWSWREQTKFPPLGECFQISWWYLLQHTKIFSKRKLKLLGWFQLRGHTYVYMDTWIAKFTMLNKMDCLIDGSWLKNKLLKLFHINNLLKLKKLIVSKKEEKNIIRTKIDYTQLKLILNPKNRRVKKKSKIILKWWN